MGRKGRAALTYLPQVDVAFIGSAGDQSIEAVKAAINQCARFQEEAGRNQTEITDVVCKTNTPYTSALWDMVALKAGTGTVTLATSLADDTCTINGLVYTAVAGAKTDNTEYSIDGSDTVDAADLADSINNDVRVGTVSTGVTATSSVGVVTVTAVDGGLPSNAITLAEDTGSTTLTVSGAVMTGGLDFELTFASETAYVVDAQGRPALGTRRLIDVIMVSNGNKFNLRSLGAVVGFIEDLEDGVARSGSGATGDATYTAIQLNGYTPFETFDWTVTKLANVYTLEATATS